MQAGDDAEEQAEAEEEEEEEAPPAPQDVQSKHAPQYQAPSGTDLSTGDRQKVWYPASQLSQVSSLSSCARLQSPHTEHTLQLGHCQRGALSRLPVRTVRQRRATSPEGYETSPGARATERDLGSRPKALLTPF